MAEKTSNIWLSTAVLIVVVMAGMYLLGYFSSGPVETEKVLDQTAPVAEIPEDLPAPSLVVGTDPKLGSYLAAPNGMTLYTFKNDKPNISNCIDNCAANWPPYIVSSDSELVMNPEVTGELSTITRTDGSMQITYNGMPLYFWSKDVNPGDVTGNGVGGIWFLAK
jgi:predicted lipoprotein with Yx(FWY)xxD motif